MIQELEDLKNSILEQRHEDALALIYLQNYNVIVFEAYLYYI